MKLMQLLEANEPIQTGDLFYSFERKSLEEITVIEPGSVLSDGSPVFRPVTNEALTGEMVERYESGCLSKDEMALPLERAGVLVFDDHLDVLEYVQRNFTIPKILDGYDDFDMEQYIKESEFSIDGIAQSAGPSFWKDECLALLRQVISKEGWDVIYNRIKDLDFMQPDPGGEKRFTSTSTSKMVTVVVKSVEATGNDIIRLNISGVSSFEQAEKAAFMATKLEEGPVCTGHIEENEDGSWFVSLKGDFNTSNFWAGQIFTSKSDQV